MITLLTEFPRARWALLPALLVTLVTAGNAQPKLSVVGGEQIRCGRIGPMMLKRAVHIVNSGSDTLHVTSVIPGCGCTSAPIDRSALGPGDTATISVSINLTEAAGEQAKSIQVVSNDKATPNKIITIQALVIRDLAVTPRSIDIPGGARIDTEYPFTIEIQNLSMQPVTIRSPRLSNTEDATARFTMTSSYKLSPKESLKLSGSVTPRRAGTIAADVVIETSSELMPTVTIPLNGVVGIAALSNLSGNTDRNGGH